MEEFFRQGVCLLCVCIFGPMLYLLNKIDCVTGIGNGIISYHFHEPSTLRPECSSDHAHTYITVD